MKISGKTLAAATVALSVPLFAGAINAQSMHNSKAAAMDAAAVSAPGASEAARLVPVNAELARALDAKKDPVGSAVEAKLTEKARLSDGTELPSGSTLMGKVVEDDMHEQGMAKLALRFDQARLKDGKVIPIHATIVGILAPAAGVNYVTPNTWTDGTLQIDQVGVLPGVDLHSNITSPDSGVLVSTKKDDVRLAKGSQVQMAIGPNAA
jgi:hypothetical protein